MTNVLIYLQFIIFIIIINIINNLDILIILIILNNIYNIIYKYIYYFHTYTGNIIQKPVELVIEKKNKTRKSGSTKFQVGTSGNGDNNKSKDFKRVFYPHKNAND